MQSPLFHRMSMLKAKMQSSVHFTSLLMRPFNHHAEIKWLKDLKFSRHANVLDWLQCKLKIVIQSLHYYFELAIYIGSFVEDCVEVILNHRNWTTILNAEFIQITRVWSTVWIMAINDICESLSRHICWIVSQKQNSFLFSNHILRQLQH